MKFAKGLLMLGMVGLFAACERSLSFRHLASRNRARAASRGPTILMTQCGGDCYPAWTSSQP